MTLTHRNKHCPDIIIIIIIITIVIDASRVYAEQSM